MQDGSTDSVLSVGECATTGAAWILLADLFIRLWTLDNNAYNWKIVCEKH